MKGLAWITAVLAVAAIPFVPTGLHAEDGQAWRHRVVSEPEGAVNEDIKEEIVFGREVAARLIGRYGLYQNERLMRYVNLVGQSLVANGNRPELTYHFAILNTEEINGYAAPGGYVFVTRGALEQMKDESELAGVLAHELTHINERHVVKELGIHGDEGSALSGLARLIGGGTESARVAFSRAVDKAMDMLFKTGYTRADEIQADEGAVTLCAVSGYDPSGLVRYFERIGPIKGKATEVLDRTHPSYDERIALLKKTMADEGIDPSDYKTYKKRFDGVVKGID